MAGNGVGRPVHSICRVLELKGGGGNFVRSVGFESPLIKRGIKALNEKLKNPGRGMDHEKQEALLPFKVLELRIIIEKRN